MANDVQPISGVMADGAKPLAAARLCNFGTGKANLLPAHDAWINGPVRAALNASPNPWIDIDGYASKRGSSRHFDNEGLSARRRDAVKSAIAQVSGKANFIRQEAHGSRLSLGGADNDDGYWRAAEVYVFGSLPKGRTPDPKPHKPPTPIEPMPPFDDWFVTNLSLTGGSIVAVVGGGAFVGSIEFEHFANSGHQKITGNIGIAGVAAGASVGIPGLKDTSIVKAALKFIADNGGLSHAELPSKTLGMCFPNKIRKQKLVSTDFFGPCATIFASGNLIVLGEGVFLLFFGIDTSVSTLRGSVEIVTGQFLAQHASGLAVISTAGLGLSASAGASINLFFGEIA